MRQKDEAKAQDILRAALDEIQAVGLAGLSIEAVARRAGVATGTVYIYFKGKEALLEALYLQVKQGFSDLVLRDEGLPLKAAFSRMVRAFLDYVVEHNAEIVFMTQIANSPYLTDAARRTAALGARPVTDLLERGKAEQLLKDIDTAWMAAFLYETVKGMAALGKDLPPARRTAFQETVATLCWDALKA
jgi:AcrR family transcriptional regulator